MLRNREFRLVLVVACGVSALTVGACWQLCPAAGLAAAAGCGLLVGVLCAFTAWRYRQLQRLAGYLACVYAGGELLDIRDNREGELSVLKNDLYKITSTLKEQASQHKRDKQLLQQGLGDISHQLRTPLAGMFVMADLLAQPGLPEEKRVEFTATLTGQLERLQWLVEGLLKLSRLDAGCLPLARQPVPVDRLLKKAAEPVQILLELKGQRLQAECPPGLVWQGDEAWTAEALANILKNCVEQTPPGGCITVAARQNPLYTHITVRDEGGGVPAEDLPHLFRRFYRGKHAASGSAGIGLALSHALITAQNGTLMVENVPGGALFTAKLYEPGCGPHAR